MAQGKPRDLKLERTWRRRLKRQQASGQSIRDYCVDYDLHESAFYFWRREIAARDRANVVAAGSNPARAGLRAGDRG